MNNDDVAAQSIRLHVRQILSRLEAHLHKAPETLQSRNRPSLPEVEREEHRSRGVLGRQFPIR